MNFKLKSILKKIIKKKSLEDNSQVTNPYSNIKIGLNTSVSGAHFEIRCSTQKNIIDIGSDCMIKGSYIIENENGQITIGNRTFIGGGLFVSAKEISIGNDVMFSWGCTIMDNDAHSLDWNHRANDVIDWKKGLDKGEIGKYKDWSNVKSAPIIIKDKVWIGFNVIILKGVTIEEGAVVAAGSVVTKNVPAFTLFAGNPAKFIKDLKC